MDAVNIAELKARLSHYLRLVRRGQPILVRDRDRVIARIEPAGDEDASRGDDARLLRDLEARGIVRRGRGGLSRSALAARPKVRADVVAALLAERDEGR
jgi:antitoxin (DNA-binding transcriptional repressor) of toxin-antitoxin stability system